MPDVIIPVLDEAAALPDLLSAIPPGYRPVVVDNGSSDGSGRIAAELGATVVFEPTRGFGAACWAGLVAADPADGVVCFMDGDGSLDPADLPLVAGPVLAGISDLVLGARRVTERRTTGQGVTGRRGTGRWGTGRWGTGRPWIGRRATGQGVTGPRAWPVHARLGNAVLAAELRRRTGLDLHDLGPMRAARVDPLRSLGIDDRRFGWPLEMVLLAAGAGWRVDEVPVSYGPRIGRSKVTGTIGGTVRTVRDMSRVLR